jgi:hypothetical protein
LIEKDNILSDQLLLRVSALGWSNRPIYAIWYIKKPKKDDASKNYLTPVKHQ